MSKLAALFIMTAALSACGGGKPPSIPDVEGSPLIGRVERADLPDLIPASGVASSDGGSRFVVNIEASDASRVHEGQEATVSVIPSTQPVVDCRVTRVLRDVSAETGQAVAWLAAEAPSGVSANDFVTARIRVGTRRGVLVVPAAAVLVRDGRQMVIKAAPGSDGKTRFEAAPVKTGLAAGDRVEIVSGLKDGEPIVVANGIGLLYSDFKALTGD